MKLSIFLACQFFWSLKPHTDTCVFFKISYPLSEYFDRALADSVAVNQALGRCIRHIGDYGALFLVDSRYTSRRSQLARWLRDSFVVHNSYRDMAQDLHKFFEDLVPQTLKDKAKETFNRSSEPVEVVVSRQPSNPISASVQGGVPTVRV